jgi:glyoxylase-like metal-dependent hydrolase (beta-lactamase superfamily II)
MPAPMLRSKPPAWYRFSIGDFEATIVSDGPIVLGSVTSEFPDAPKAEVQALLDRDLLPEDPMVLQQNALVLNTGKRLAIFDTGMGTSTMFGEGSGRMLRNLAAAGIDAGDIDAVILTHPHPDHAWGLVGEGGRRNFPNAEVFLSKVDFDFWTDLDKLNDKSERAPAPNAIIGARDSLLPYKDRLSFVESGKEAIPGVTAVATPGHTLGHTSYVIQSGGESFINLGDVCHHQALLFPNPQWEYKYDTDPKLAARSRQKVWEMAVADKLRLIGFHFPFPGVGNIVREGAGFRYVPLAMELV